MKQTSLKITLVLCLVVAAMATDYYTGNYNKDCGNKPCKRSSTKNGPLVLDVDAHLNLLGIDVDALIQIPGTDGLQCSGRDSSCVYCPVGTLITANVNLSLAVGKPVVLKLRVAALPIKVDLDLLDQIKIDVDVDLSVDLSKLTVDLEIRKLRVLIVDPDTNKVLLDAYVELQVDLSKLKLGVLDWVLKELHFVATAKVKIYVLSLADIVVGPLVISS